MRGKKKKKKKTKGIPIYRGLECEINFKETEKESVEGDPRKRSAVRKDGNSQKNSAKCC